MKETYPDGTVEIESSTCCCPPDKKRGGVHTRAFTFWARLNEGEWKKIHFSTNANVLRSFSSAKKCFAHITNP